MTAVLGAGNWAQFRAQGSEGVLGLRVGGSLVLNPLISNRKALDPK